MGKSPNIVKEGKILPQIRGKISVKPPPTPKGLNPNKPFPYKRVTPLKGKKYKVNKTPKKSGKRDNSPIL